MQLIRDYCPPCRCDLFWTAINGVMNSGEFRKPKATYAKAFFDVMLAVISSVIAIQNIGSRG